MNEVPHIRVGFPTFYIIFIVRGKVRLGNSALIRLRHRRRVAFMCIDDFGLCRG